uniref:Uncharacterized protein n=1 Tax=Rhizophora mucronata TaxID=61149 RepID=A0A2P2P9Z1_RHIMU
METPSVQHLTTWQNDMEKT